VVFGLCVDQFECRAEVFISNSDGTVHFSAVAGESLLCSALNLSKQLDEAGHDNKIQNIQDRRWSILTRAPPSHYLRSFA